jgi:hypothetical protein
VEGVARKGIHRPVNAHRSAEVAHHFPIQISLALEQ